MNSFGNLFNITFSGESHGEGYFVIINGMPSNISLTEDEIYDVLKTRRPGHSELTSPRKEKDYPKLMTGVFEGKTTGAPITIFIKNTNQNSKDYEHLKNLIRPGHADFTYFQKFGHRDYRGGGFSSARMSATWVAAGVLAQKILDKKNIKINAYTHSIGEIKVGSTTSLDSTLLENELGCPDPKAYQKMKSFIQRLKEEGDSIGSSSKVVVENMPLGLGSPFRGSLKAKIASYIFSCPAIMALEFGTGTQASLMKGSQHNDELNENLKFKSNHHGGVLGGISSGTPLEFLVSLKPPSSIKKKQTFYNTQSKSLTEASVSGRHDPCLAPRFNPVAKALTQLALADELLLNLN